MNIRARDRQLFELIIFILLIVAGWYFWLSPTAINIQKGLLNSAQLHQEEQTLANRKTFIDATTKELASNSEARKLLELAAPSSPDMENLLASLDAMAIASGISLSSVQPQNISDNPTKLIVTITVSGTFIGIQNFISFLERNERPIAIQTLTLAGSNSALGSTLITGNISFSTQLVGESSVAKSAAAKGAE